MKIVKIPEPDPYYEIECQSCTATLGFNRSEFGELKNSWDFCAKEFVCPHCGFKFSLHPYGILEFRKPNGYRKEES